MFACLIAQLGRGPISITEVCLCWDRREGRSRATQRHRPVVGALLAFALVVWQGIQPIGRGLAVQHGSRFL